MNFASNIITDMVNPEYEMFHSKGYPPNQIKIITAREPSDITRISLARITEYLMEFVKSNEFTHHRTDTLLMSDGSTCGIDENSLIVRIGYNDAPDRVMTFQLSLNEASLNLN